MATATDKTRMTPADATIETGLDLTRGEAERHPICSAGCNSLAECVGSCVHNNDQPEPDDTPAPDDLVELAEWSARTTARELLDASKLLTLAELAEHQAAFYRSWGHGAGDLFARTMEELAQKVRYVNATTPADFEARADAIDAEGREHHETVGYQAGLEAGREECRRKPGRTPLASFGGHPSFED
jgi:hypothetical protein